jgi:hypothetical protein
MRREMTGVEKVRRGVIAVRTIGFKVLLFGGATAIAMWVWHYFTAHPHPFAAYMEDNSKMALYIEALKALLYESWGEAGEVLEEEIEDV